jgi:hypothetical protein
MQVGRANLAPPTNTGCRDQSVVEFDAHCIGLTPFHGDDVRASEIEEHPNAESAAPEEAHPA